MHRTTPEFRSLLDDLPQSVQRVARQNFELLKAIRGTRRFGSGKLAHSGRSELAVPTVRSPLRTAKISPGYGSVLTVNMTG